MIREASRHATSGGHYIHVDVAIVVAGIGDLRAVGRERHVTHRAASRGKALRVSTLARDGPRVAGVDERHRRRADRGMLQKLGSLVGVATASWHRALQSGSLLRTTRGACGENEGRPCGA